MTTPQRVAVASIEWYQRAADGRPSPCRFTPSCSAYAHEAFTTHGTIRGLVLTLRRLVRCRPFGPSGFDPVPEARSADAPTASTGTTIPTTATIPATMTTRSG